MTVRTAFRSPGPLAERELEAWGERVGSAVEAPVILALRGELGAGKSVLARAVAKGAGVVGPMPSPTYNLLFRYPSADRAVVLVHLDLYRLNDPEEVLELGWEELGEAEEIVLVEWPERAGALLDMHPSRWDVWLEVVSADRRTVRAVPAGGPPALPGFP